ncbi:129R [Invertebrate iridescent virus Kaz2018]|uniref:129R n=1 Tax=Invertebrate iridescent virus 6 TaxID=176652 RepID=Q91G08_IIV6|nr:129R [Invertebrate iridescent virus 6]AAK82024.1 129R [Invertebrate iridescent virus 6]QMS79320.1 hypothetical protein IIV6-T1_133 [Invertebrate iridescent virus 6]QNH08539.1 129R [Invertebrate iridescent virus Kaz2018]
MVCFLYREKIVSSNFQFLWVKKINNLIKNEVNSKCVSNRLSIPKYFRRKTMYHHDSQIMF